MFKTYFDKLNASLETLTNGVDRAFCVELDMRLEKMAELFPAFDAIQNKIEFLADEDELGNQFTERQNFEDNFYRFSTRNLLTKHNFYELDNGEEFLRSTSSGSSSHRSKTEHVALKSLPKLPIPTFSGKSENWLEFRDTFSFLVHKNERLDNIEKFHFLRGALDGDAKQFIGTLEFSDSGYGVAWNLLLERFKNTSLLVNNNLECLVNLPEIRKENAVDLRKMLDILVKNLRSLNSLGVNTEYWDIMVIFLACSKLDLHTKREWEERKNKAALPTLDEFKSFLKGKVDSLEGLGMNNSVSIIKEKCLYRAKLKSYVSVNQKCAFCNADHFIQNCKSFFELNTYARFQKALHLKVGLNCLRPGHMSKDCSQRGCKKCGSKHNVLLHYDKNKNNSILLGSSNGSVGSAISESGLVKSKEETSLDEPKDSVPTTSNV
ncbi:uncharacterized protein LOC130903793 [Diorhabda carinulata]|uniref:uncharacterized protein LOC130903793 n=1 Tax=Diorhabda carinulata TaxID=1163345 RepID=UPI0025A027ED|nr:uncharacterized protein LOC130903793 [Diorhabda carinulata]